MKIRQSKLPDPKYLPNTGSFFKNPLIASEQFELLNRQYPDLPSYPTSIPDTIKIPAGWLIEKAGFKGKKYENVAVHEKQALVLVNHGDATANELLQLVKTIQLEIQQKFNIELEAEVQII